MNKPSYDASTSDGQKRLMDESAEREHIAAKPINVSCSKDYGADPLGDGTFKMVPSGDIVDYQERKRRLQD